MSHQTGIQGNGATGAGAPGRRRARALEAPAALEPLWVRRPGSCPSAALPGRRHVHRRQCLQESWVGYGGRPAASWPRLPEQEDPRPAKPSASPRYPSPQGDCASTQIIWKTNKSRSSRLPPKLPGFLSQNRSVLSSRRNPEEEVFFHLWMLPRAAWKTWSLWLHLITPWRYLCILTLHYFLVWK